MALRMYGKMKTLAFLFDFHFLSGEYPKSPESKLWLQFCGLVQAETLFL